MSYAVDYHMQKQFHVISENENDGIKHFIVFLYYGNLCTATQQLEKGKVYGFHAKSLHKLAWMIWKAFFVNNDESSGANAQGSLPQSFDFTSNQ